MKRLIWSVLALALIVAPSLAFAKGVPLFFQTGDELFEVEGAPEFEDGYTVGYACQRLGVLGADLWTWDCELMAINVDEFSAGELPDDLKTELSQAYSLGDRVRSPWNQYGGFVIGAVLLGGIVLRRGKKNG